MERRRVSLGGFVGQIDIDASRLRLYHGQKPQPDGISQIDRVSILKHRQVADTLPVDERTIGAANIFDRKAVGAPHDTHVSSRHFGIGQNEIISGAPADGQLFALQRNLGCGYRAALHDKKRFWFVHVSQL